MTTKLHPLVSGLRRPVILTHPTLGGKIVRWAGFVETVYVEIDGPGEDRFRYSGFFATENGGLAQKRFRPSTTANLIDVDTLLLIEDVNRWLLCLIEQLNPQALDQHPLALE